MSANDELAGRMARMDVDEFRRAALRLLEAPEAGFAVELTAAAPIIPTPTLTMTIASAPPRPAGIPWVPIADCPEAWKDGRQLLAWSEYGPIIGAYSTRWRNGPLWATAGGSDFNPTHVAELYPPEGV